MWLRSVTDEYFRAMIQASNMTVHRRLCNLLLIVLAGCGAASPVRVLEKDQTAITGSIGGPIVPSSSPIGFIPYVTGGVAHGVLDDLTVHANLHALMSAYAVLGLDAGASYRVYKGNGAVPEITVGARALFFTDFRALNTSRIYPDLHANLSWEVAERTLLYGGAHVTFQWSPGATFVSPNAGILFPVSNAVSLQAELIWQAANVNTQYGVFSGQSSIGGTGSFGGFVGAVVRL